MPKCQLQRKARTILAFPVRIQVVECAVFIRISRIEDLVTLTDTEHVHIRGTGPDIQAECGFALERLLPTIQFFHIGREQRQNTAGIDLHGLGFCRVDLWREMIQEVTLRLGHDLAFIQAREWPERDSADAIDRRLDVIEPEILENGEQAKLAILRSSGVVQLDKGGVEACFCTAQLHLKRERGQGGRATCTIVNTDDDVLVGAGIRFGRCSAQSAVRRVE